MQVVNVVTLFCRKFVVLAIQITALCALQGCYPIIDGAVRDLYRETHHIDEYANATVIDGDSGLPLEDVYVFVVWIHVSSQYLTNRDTWTCKPGELDLKTDAKGKYVVSDFKETAKQFGIGKKLITRQYDFYKVGYKVVERIADGKGGAVVKLQKRGDSNWIELDIDHFGAIADRQCWRKSAQPNLGCSAGRLAVERHIRALAAKKYPDSRVFKETPIPCLATSSGTQ